MQGIQKGEFEIRLSSLAGKISYVSAVIRKQYIWQKWTTL